jgi:predicted dehydrogenase
VTFERFLALVDNHPRCNILYDPSHMLLQQMDYLTFIDIYHARIKAFHVKDAEFRPNGRSGVYGGYQPWINRAGRFRSLGDGQIDFKGIFSKLTQYDYDGWAVLEWECCLKDGDTGASEGSEFIRRHIIPVPGARLMISPQGAAMINVGIIGSGFIGPAHIEALRRLGLCRWWRCATARLPGAGKSAQLNVPHAYASVEELLAHPICTWCTTARRTCTRRLTARSCARASTCFSEKPLCMTPDEARELVALAEQAGVVHGVSFVYRQFAMVRQAASMMRAGSRAAVCLTRQLSAGLDAAGNRLQLAGGCRARRRIARGGGYRLPLVRHGAVCDRAAHYRGDGRSLHRLADAQGQQGGNQTFSHDEQAEYVDKPVTTEDFGSVLFRFDDGSKGCFSVSQVSAGRKNRLTFEINGSERSAGVGSGGAAAAVDRPSRAGQPDAHRRSGPDEP